MNWNSLHATTTSKREVSRSCASCVASTQSQSWSASWISRQTEHGNLSRFPLRSRRNDRQTAAASAKKKKKTTVWAPAARCKHASMKCRPVRWVRSTWLHADCRTRTRAEETGHTADGRVCVAYTPARARGHRRGMSNPNPPS
jgi:hypothetical protein